MGLHTLMEMQSASHHYGIVKLCAGRKPAILFGRRLSRFWGWQGARRGAQGGLLVGRGRWVALLGEMVEYFDDKLTQEYDQSCFGDVD